MLSPAVNADHVNGTDSHDVKDLQRASERSAPDCKFLRKLLGRHVAPDVDVERERAVNHAVRQLALTRIIVAHRPETIASTGRVVALHDGRVAQDLRSVPASMPTH